MTVDPRQLALFLEVVRAGSFSGAAARRNLTQPAVSMAIAQLERALGARLLERTRLGVVLTPAGLLVQRRAEAMEYHVNAAVAEVQARQMGLAGPLVVGGTPGALLSVLPGILRLMAESHPNLALHIREGTDAELMDLLRAGKVDAVVGTTRMDAVAADIVEIDVCADSFVIVARPGWRSREHGRAPSLALRDLGGERWVLPAGRGAFQRQVSALFLSAGIPMPQDVVRCDSLATTKEIVRTSGFLCLLPQRVVAVEVQHGLLDAFALEDEPLRRSVGLRFLRQAAGAPLNAAFAQAAVEAFRS